jgi:crotonobetainyl-CoA:carnitine CoA-transferase CaiB-like acyl-CoA transferase
MNTQNAHQETATLPLNGIRVVELSHMVMGPTCGMILGDLGAEVIKVEPPKGDGTRRLLGTGAGFFRTFNRNKKSVALDTSSAEGREALLKLVDTADVFVENFKPGRMKDLGVDYASLRKRNPKLIYVSHKGFLNGPYENRLALDEVVQMMAGLAYMTGPVGRRQRTGVGKEVQSALFENCVLLAAQHMQQYAVTGEPAAPMPERISAWAVYDVFELANKEQMFIAATGDGQWRALCRLIGREDLLADPNLATNNQRVVARVWLLPTLRETLLGFDAATLAPLLEQHHIPFAAITRPEELFNDPHLRASGGLAPLTVDDGTQTDMPLLPISMNGERLQPRQPIAKIGEHTYEILHDLGYSDEQIAALMQTDAEAASA